MATAVVVLARTIYFGYERLGLRLSGIYIEIVVAALASVVALGVARNFGWLRAVGFTAPRQWRSLHLWWWVLVWVLLALVSVTDKPAIHRPLSVALVAVLTLFVALSEETAFRGVTLEAFLPGGVRRAILFQAALFGAFHANNILGGLDLKYVATQVAVAGLLGVFLGALRVRMNALWPSISIHFLLDFGGFIHGGANLGESPPTPQAIAIGIGFYAILAAIGIFVLARRSRVYPPPVVEAAPPAPAIIPPTPAAAPTLSPDGKYILVGGTWHPATYTADRSHVWNGRVWQPVWPTGARFS